MYCASVVCVPSVSTRRIPGLGQITWQIALTKKIEGPLGKKIAQKSRNSCSLRGENVGAKGMEVNLATNRHLETKHKRSKIAFTVTSIVLSLVLLGNKLLQLPVQSLIGSPNNLNTSCVVALQTKNQKTV